MDTEKIGNYIKQLRLKNNLTQEELAQKIFVTNKAISRWETGKSIPEIETLYLLSKELNVSVNDILEAGSASKEEVKKFFDKKKIKDKIPDIILAIIIFIIPAIFIATSGILSMSIFFEKLNLGDHLSKEIIRSATSETLDFVLSYTIGDFLIPWIIFLISYIGYKLNKNMVIHISSILCILIILYSVIFPNTIIGSSIISELVILIINIIEIIILKKQKDK